LPAKRADGEVVSAAARGVVGTCRANRTIAAAAVGALTADGATVVGACCPFVFLRCCAPVERCAVARSLADPRGVLSWDSDLLADPLAPLDPSVSATASPGSATPPRQRQEQPPTRPLGPPDPRSHHR